MRLPLILSLILWIPSSLYPATLDDIQGWEDNKDTESLIQVLGDPVDLIRTKAAEALERLNEHLGQLIHKSLRGSEKAKEELIIKNDPRAVLPLLNALNSSNQALRREGREFLLRVKDNQSVYTLINTLEYASPAEQKGALILLKEIGGKSGVNCLITILHDKDFEIQRSALKVLSKMRDGHSVDRLPELLNDGTPQVRQVTAIILGYLNDKEAINPLIHLLGDRHEIVQIAAAKALEKLGDDLGNLVYQSLAGSKKIRQQLIVRNDPRAIAPIFRVLKGGQPDFRKEAAKTLSMLSNNRAFELLILSLSDADPNLREAVVWALEGSDDERAHANLIRALEDPAPTIREAVAEVLGNKGEKQAVDPLLNALGDRYPYVRQAAATALEKLGEPIGPLINGALKGSKEAIEELQKHKDQRILPPFMQALKHGDSTLREKAVTVLGQLGGKESFETLIKSLSDEDPKVRAAVVSSLGNIGDKRAVMPVIKSLHDPDPGVQNAATWALTKFPDERAFEPLIDILEAGDRDLQLAATWALAWVLGKVADKRALDPLLAVLQKGDPELRSATLFALVKLEDPRGFTALTKALDDKNSDVRKCAVLNLAAKPNEKTLELILTAMGDEAPDVHKTAIEALSTIGQPLNKLIKDKDPRVVEPLIRCLGLGDRALRRKAARTLGRLGDKRAVNGLTRMAAGWNIRDRIAATRALMDIKQDKITDYFLTVLGIIFRPASLIYIACMVFILALVPYKLTSHLRKTKNSAQGLSTVRKPQENYNKEAVPTENSATTYFRMVITNKDGEPYALKDYRLTVDGSDYFGKTDRHGLVEEEVPPNSKKGTLSLLQNDENASEKNTPTWTLELG